MAAEKVSYTFREGQDEDPTPVSEETTATESRASVSTESESGSESPSDDRPEWLPEKFKDPADLARAYSELEKKFSGRGASDPSTKEEKTSDPTSKDNSMRLSGTEEETPESGSKVDFDAVEQEYIQNDGLSEETLDALEKSGYSRRFVDRYINGLKAEANAVRSRAAEAVGGEENLSAMMEWARTNLSDAEKNAFDQSWQSGNEAVATMAVRGIFAQYQNEVGSDPNLLTGDVRSSGSGVTPFADMEEYVEAIRDPRYKSSTSFRREVDRRLEASTDW